MEEENKKTTEVFEKIEKASKTHMEKFHWMCANYLETMATECDYDKFCVNMIKEETCYFKQLNDIPEYSWRYDRNNLKFLYHLMGSTKNEKLNHIDSIKHSFKKDHNTIKEKRELFLDKIVQFIGQDRWKIAPTANNDFNGCF
jgi:hypothetical protein